MNDVRLDPRQVPTRAGSERAGRVRGPRLGPTQRTRVAGASTA